MKFRPLTWIFILILACGIVGFSYHLLEKHSEKSLLDDAAGFLLAGDLENTARYAYRVYQRNPQSVRAIRLLAQVLERVDARFALPWWEKTLYQRPNDFEAFSRVVMLKLNTSRQSEIEKLLSAGNERFQHFSAYHKLAALAFLRFRQYERAHQSFTHALECDPENMDALLGKLLLESQSSDPAQADKAVVEIKGLADSDLPVSDHAIFNLLTSNLNQKLTLQEQLDYTRRYLDKKEQNFSRSLEVIQAAKGLSSERVQRLIERFEKNNLTSSIRLARYGNALNQIGHSADVIRMKERFESGRNEYPVLNDVYLDALIAEKNWDEAQSWLNSIHKDSRLGWYSLLARGLKVEMDWKQLDRKIIELELSQTDNPHQLSMIISKADLHDWPVLRELALWEMVEYPDYEETALSLLKEHYVQNQDGRGVLQVSQKILEIHPELIGARATVAHLSMCRGVDLQRAHRLARECYQQQPDNPSLRMIYLISLHLNKREEEERLIFNLFQSEDRRIPGMELYFEYFEWILGLGTKAPQFGGIPDGYLDLEMEFLQTMVSRNQTDSISR